MNNSALTPYVIMHFFNFFAVAANQLLLVQIALCVHIMSALAYAEQSSFYAPLIVCIYLYVKHKTAQDTTKRRYLSLLIF